MVCFNFPTESALKADPKYFGTKNHFSGSSVCRLKVFFQIENLIFFKGDITIFVRQILKMDVRFFLREMGSPCVEHSGMFYGFQNEHVKAKQNFFWPTIPVKKNVSKLETSIDFSDLALAMGPWVVTFRGLSCTQNFFLAFSYFKQVEVDLFCVGVFLFVNTHEQILNINNYSQQTIQFLLFYILQMWDVGTLTCKKNALRDDFKCCGIRSLYLQ